MMKTVQLVGVQISLYAREKNQTEPSLDNFIIIELLVLVPFPDCEMQVINNEVPMP